MDKETFGSIKKYESLGHLTDMINSMEDKHRKYIASVINEFNYCIKVLESIADLTLRKYILGLVCNDYIKKVNTHIVNKYERKVGVYIKRYIYIRIRNAKL